MDERAKWLVALAGVASSALTAALVVVIGRVFGFNLFGLSMIVIVPVGAIICGALASSGFFWAAKATHRPPTIGLLAQMLVAAGCTQWLIYWSQYATLVIEGVPVSAVIPFKEYLSITLTHTHLALGRAGRADMGEVGRFGYLLAVLHFIGLIVGGAWAFVALRGQPACYTCGTYLVTLFGKKQRFEDADRFADYYRAEFEHPVESEAFAAHVGYDHAYEGTSGAWVLTTKLMACSECGDQAVRETVTAHDGKSWNAVGKLARLVRAPAGVDLRPAYERGLPVGRSTSDGLEPAAGRPVFGRKAPV